MRYELDKEEARARDAEQYERMKERIMQEAAYAESGDIADKDYSGVEYDKIGKFFGNVMIERFFLSMSLEPEVIQNSAVL